MFSVEELVIQHRKQKVTVVNVKKRITPTGRADGMGILYMGYESVFCKKPPPWMRNRARITPSSGSTDLDDSLDEDRPKETGEGVSPPPSMDLISTGANVGFSDELQTVLDTGAIKLIRSTCANSGAELCEQVSVPMWVFTNTGPNVYYPQIDDKVSGELDGDEDGSPTGGAECRAPVPLNRSSNAPVDLNTCRQFSVVHYEDLSDPKKSMVMIQTPEKKSIHDVETGIQIKAIEDGSGDKIKQLESEIDCSELQLNSNSPLTDGIAVKDTQYSVPAKFSVTSSQNNEQMNSDNRLGLIVRPKVPDPNKVKLTFDSMESPDDPPITSPTIAKYVSQDDPYLLVNRLKDEPASQGQKWDAMDEFAEFATRCRPGAHAQAQGENVSNSPIAHLKETKVKSKLADSGLYRPASEVSNQLSLSHDVDSGIWDMIQGKDGEQSSQSSSRGSTPVILAGRCDEPKHVMPLVSDIQELNLGNMIPSSPLITEGEKPSIAYRAFKVDSEMNEVVLSKAKLATYVPLLEEQALPELVGSEIGAGAITTIEECGGVSENVLRISEISESDPEEYHLAVESKVPVRSASESEGDVFESAVENVESSEALTDTTPVAEEVNGWCVLSNEQSTLDQQNGGNQDTNISRTGAEHEIVEDALDREADDHTTGKSSAYMVSECTQTSPTSPRAIPGVDSGSTQPVRKLSAHRQRSYMQAVADSDVTSPESETGWFTAQENLTDSNRRVKTKLRKKSREEGRRSCKDGEINAQNGQGVCESSTSEVPSSTSDDVTSSTDTCESPNTPTVHTVQDINRTNISGLKNGEREMQAPVPTVTEIKVEYDYSARRGPGALVSDIQNAIDLNYQHEYCGMSDSDQPPEHEKSNLNSDIVESNDIDVSSTDRERSPKFLQTTPKGRRKKGFKSPDNVSTHREISRGGLNNVSSISHDFSAPNFGINSTNRQQQAIPKPSRSKNASSFLKSAGKEHIDGFSNGQNDAADNDADSDVTPSADDEERQLLACGSEDFRQRDVTLNPFEATPSPVMSHKNDRRGLVKKDNIQVRVTDGSMIARKGVVSKTSPTQAEVSGLGLNQLQAARVVTRNPSRPTSMASRQGVGLNQLQTSSPTAKRKATFHLSLLSPSGSASSEEHSPAHRSSSRGSESPYFVASYNDGSDWGDESLLWDADDDSDDANYVPDAESEACDYEKFPDWMSELAERLHDVPLTSLAIPGSHISCAIERDMKIDMDIAKSNYEMAEFLRKLPNLSIFNNFRSLIKQIWKAWMPKQMLSITQQLYAGVRYLDIRVTKYRSALYAEHGLYSKQLIKYLKEIKCFLDSHPKEVVILHFEALNQIDTKDKRRLVTSLFQIFGARMAKASAELSKVTLKSLWRRKKQVIIVFPATDTEALHNHIFVGLIWSDNLLTRQNPKAQTQDELRNYLDSTYYNAHAMRTKKDTFQVTRAVLSPDMSMLFGEYEYQSMKQLTVEETHHCVNKWLQHKTNLNIVAFDFVGANQLVETVIRLNDSKFVLQTTV